MEITTCTITYFLAAVLCNWFHQQGIIAEIYLLAIGIQYSKVYNEQTLSTLPFIQWCPSYFGSCLWILKILDYCSVFLLLSKWDTGGNTSFHKTEFKMQVQDHFKTCKKLDRCFIFEISFSTTGIVRRGQKSAPSSFPSLVFNPSTFSWFIQDIPRFNFA